MISGVLNGPDIRKLMKNNEFDNTLGDEEKIAWNSVKAVIHNCLGADRSEDWQLHINAMLASFENIGVSMSLKIHFLHYHMDHFGRQVPTESDEHGERFHQVAAPLESWYSGKKLNSMLADLCWNLIVENEE